MFFPHPLKKRHGGPYSVLYHLREGLKSFDHSVLFLSDLVVFESSKSTERKSSALRNNLKKLLPKKWVSRIKISRWLTELEESVDQRITNLKFNEYDILHFHETIDIWRYRHILNEYTGIIILTSHSPKPYHRELVEDVLGLNILQINKASLRQLHEIDAYAYSKADYCVFPNLESSESYYQLWENFAKVVEGKRIFSVATGVTAPDTLQHRSLIRENLNIPSSAFIVTFVGRQNQVKGIDLLVDLAAKALPKYADLYFLIIGKKERNSGIDHHRWIETGWINDPLSYIKSGNLHLIPNRFSNFDLNILEALSIGQPILLSETGGNKFLKQFNSEGLFFHPLDGNGFMNAFENCYALRKELPQRGLANKKVYEDNFTAEKFARRHLEFYQKIN